MRLRIISGDFRGRFINTIQDKNPFRPTLERVRQSVAEIIKDKIEGAVCADICAGSGAFGFEMISRGAIFTEFVENNIKRAQKIYENADALKCKDLCFVYAKDVLMFLKMSKRHYDIIYFDPPYDLPECKNLLDKLIQLLTTDGILIYERRREKETMHISDIESSMFDKREFGGTVVEFYKKQLL